MLQRVAFGEAFDGAVAVLADMAGEIVSDADVEACRSACL
jgi:hypothetical protein